MAFAKVLAVLAFVVNVCQADYLFGCDTKYLSVSARVLETECEKLEAIKTMDYNTYTACIEREYKTNIDEAVKNCSITITGKEMDFFKSLSRSCVPILKPIGRLGTCCVITKVLNGNDVNEDEDGTQLRNCIDEAIKKGKSS